MNNVICETEVPILGFVGINCISHLHRKQPMEGSSFLNRTVVRVSLLLFNSTVESRMKNGIGRGPVS